MPLFVPLRVDMSYWSFKVLSGPYTATSSTRDVSVHTNPRGNDPREFDVSARAIKKRDTNGRIAVTDDATQAAAQFQVRRANGTAPAREPVSRDSCPAEPAVIPANLDSALAQFRLEGGPYSASSSSADVALTLYPNFLDVRCVYSVPPSSSCQGEVTVMNTDTRATLTFGVHLRG